MSTLDWWTLLICALLLFSSIATLLRPRRNTPLTTLERVGAWMCLFASLALALVLLLGALT